MDVSEDGLLQFFFVDLSDDTTRGVAGVIVIGDMNKPLISFVGVR